MCLQNLMQLQRAPAYLDLRCDATLIVTKLYIFWEFIVLISSDMGKYFKKLSECKITMLQTRSAITQINCDDVDLFS